jgi:3-hydroxymyristoyl/3-hydroxydecanoyl-(acyl carrier protein) dehydratase
MMRLVDRVPLIDPAGGRFGIGFIRAEYDIRPREWFIECHFVDDKVMPGTLMYECCLHTLRILLHRLGLVGPVGTVCEPVPGVASRLKCRGQVLETTRTVTYEVSIKELGYGPDAYAIADALMFADGKPIVEIGNLSLRMVGVNAELMHRSREAAPHQPLSPKQGSKRYDTASIQAFSNGNPSVAFGEAYRIFDRDRVIARLPGPPYQFLDQVVEVTGEPFVLKESAACVAEYAVPPDAWYFAANRSPHMPFSVLLEVALQPCGWLAAYCGSALTSPTDLSFRNLGGSATQFRDVTAATGTLTTRVEMTKVSNSAGMIIQHYTMSVTDALGPVYEGTTYFGFFAKDALRNQVGMPTAKVPFLTDEQKHLAETGTLPHETPFPDAMLRMVDIIDGWLPHGGRAGLGLIQGRIAVDPSFWFFKAHFFQDPVWPGSLGLESFLQLLKYVAWKKFGEPGPAGWQTVALNRKHDWTYRGQVVPTDQVVTVVLEITAEDRANRTLTAAGFLTVDGRIIYQMTGFTLQA